MSQYEELAEEILLGGRTIERIVVDPDILVGKPVVRGTRIPVYAVLRHLAQDIDLDDLFEAYPRLTREDVKACLEYAAALVEGEEIYPVFPRRRTKPSAK